MAGQTTWNKATVPVGTDPWSAVPDVKKSLDTAGLVFSVANVTERNGLAALAPGGVLPVPTLVWRVDLPGYESWDGTVWRQVTGRKHARFTGTANTTGGAAWGFGVFTDATPAGSNNTFATPGPASKIAISTPGIYSVIAKAASSAAPGFYYLSIKNDADNLTYSDASNGGGPDWGVTASMPVLLLTAATNILFGLRTTNSVTTPVTIDIFKVSD